MLQPLNYDAFSSALESAGCSRDEISKLSDASGRSLTVLRRRLSTVPAVQTPAWAADETTATSLIPFCLSAFGTRAVRRIRPYSRSSPTETRTRRWSRMPEVGKDQRCPLVVRRQFPRRDLKNGPAVRHCRGADPCRSAPLFRRSKNRSGRMTPHLIFPRASAGPQLSTASRASSRAHFAKASQRHWCCWRSMEITC